MFHKYRNRLENLGSSFAEVASKNANDMLDYRFQDSTSYKEVFIDGEPYDARIIIDAITSARGGIGSYKIQFKNGVYFPAGTYIDIPNKQDKLVKWMIIYSSDDLLFDKPLIKKCNYLLKWKNHYGEIIERWCVFSDNSKLNNGDRTAAKDRLLLPYSTFPLVLPYDEETVNIRRNDRFLIDDKNVIDAPDCYIVTNRNIVTKTFGEYDGNIELALSQHQFNPETDNRELMIANYYGDYAERDEAPTSKQYVCNIKYQNESSLKMSTPYKVYSAEFFVDGEKVDVTPVWEVNILEELKRFIDYKVENNKLYIKAKYNKLLLGSHINIAVSDENGLSNDSLVVKVVSAI